MLGLLVLRRPMNRGSQKETVMYVRTVHGLGQGTELPCSLDLTSATSDQQRDQRLRAALECELNLRFTGPTDPRLIERRRRLRALFKSVPLGISSALRRELEEGQSPLARLFWGRLARATSRELLGLLCQGFFRKYELCFNPASQTFSVDNHPTMSTNDKTDRKTEVSAIAGILVSRLTARLNGASLPSLPAALDLSVGRLSEAQVALFRESFPDGAAGIDFQSFQRCFERFANGELRDPFVPGHPGLGEPDSGFYFLFAEFAFLCVDSNINKDIWLEALKTFVKTQEIFMHVYRERPERTPPPVDDPVPTGPKRRELLGVSAGRGFAFAHFAPVGKAVTVGRGQSDLQRKLALRAKYDSMDLNGLTAAARDNLVRAVRM